MTKLILAVDPGITGAFALLDQSGTFLAVDDLPVIADQKTKWIDADAFVSALLQRLNGQDTTAIIERVHPMPRNGSQAAFSQGMTLGSILAALQVVRARIEFVTPQSWKRQLGLVSSKDQTDGDRKRASLDMARLRFPEAPLDRQKDHGRAEALLIAHWYIARSARALAA